MNERFNVNWNVLIEAEQKKKMITLFDSPMIHASKIAFVISEVCEAVAFSELVNKATSALRINIRGEKLRRI